MPRSLIYAGLFIFIGFLGFIILAPFVIPANSYKTQVRDLIENNTGWRIQFGGNISIGVFPTVRLNAENIEVSPPDSAPILTAKNARFALGLSSLFKGAVNIEEIFLNQPDITLELTEDGTPVWLNGTAHSPQDIVTENTNHTENNNNSSNNIVDALITKLSIERLAIEGATIRYSTAGDDFTTLSNLSLSASLPDPQGALNLAGNALFNGDLINLDGEISNFKNLISQEASNLDFSVTYKAVDIKLAGNASPQGETLFNGNIEINAQALDSLIDIPTLNGSLSATGSLVANQEKIVLSLPNGQFSDSDFNLNLNADISSAKPVISGAINLGTLDLTPFLNQSPHSSANGQDEKEQDTIEKSNPKAPQNELSALSAFDTNITFSAQKLLIEDREVTDINGTITLFDGALNLTLNNLNTAVGRAKASLSTNVTQHPLVTYGSLKTENLSLPLLMQLSGQKLVSPQIDGFINTDMVFGFQGFTTDDIVATANARGVISLKNAKLSKTGLGDIMDDPSADNFENLSLQLKFDGLDAPVLLDGKTNWRGEQLLLSAKTTPLPLLQGESAATQAYLSFSKAKATYEGAVSIGLPANGIITLEGKSLRGLASWLKIDLPKGRGYEKFHVKTAFSATPTRLALSDLNLLVDAIKGQGNANIDIKEKPDIRAKFQFETLNLEPYLTVSSKSAPPNTSTRASSGPSGNTQNAWSNEPIDFSFANTANLNLEANVKTLKASGLTVGPLKLKASLQDGFMQSNLTEMDFYKGKAQAEFILDARSSTPEFTAKLDASNIQGYPFLKDFAAFDRIEGLLNYQLNVTSQGKSEAQLISALNGTTAFNFSDGALRGINIAKAMRRLTSGSLKGWNSVSDEKTDFSQFNASFNIQNGLASNDDLNLLGPLVRVKGSGTIDLPNQTIDYRVDPKVVASLQGQGTGEQNAGRQDDLAGFAVPILIKGPWATPRIYPDIKGFLEDPQTGLARLKALGGDFSKIAEGKPAELIATLGNDPKDAALNSVGSAIKEKTGLDVSTLINDGKLSKENGTKAAIDLVGGLLGNKKPEPQITPLQAGEIPVPRPRPHRNVQQANPADAVGTVLQQIIKPQNDQNQNNGQPSPRSDQVIRGLNNLFNR